MGYNKEGTYIKDLMLLIPGLLLVFHIPTISKNKGYENLAASIDSTNETFHQSYSKDLDASEAPTFLGCFKLPLPPVVRRPQTIKCAAVRVLQAG